jgi:FkbM family methyltransferase
MKFRSHISDYLGYCQSLISKIDLLDDNQKFIRKLLLDGIKIDTAYDIGAYKGVWTRRLKYIIPSAEFILFEANSTHEPELKKTKSRYFLEALSDTENNRQWWTDSSTGDSLFRENQHFYQNLNPVVKRTRTLDSILSEFKLPLPNLIKIDVQGWEKKVLTGVQNIMQTDKPILIVEFDWFQLSKAGVTCEELFDYIRSNNYYIFYLEYHYPSDHVCVHNDNLADFRVKFAGCISPHTENNELNNNIDWGITEKIVMK